MHISFSRTRQLFIVFVLVSLFAVLFARLLYVQIISHKFLTNLADKQHKIFITLEPQRGNIYDRMQRVLAIYLDTASVYAVPREISDKRKVADMLVREFGVDREDLLRKFSKDNYFAWVKRKVDSASAEKAKHLDIKGVYLTNESKRFYPCGKLSCHVLGMIGIDNEGLEGVELYYNKELAGEHGWRRSTRDAKQREVTSPETETLPARDGMSLVLTIDEVIQHIIEKEIESIAQTYRPEAVTVVALDPKTGEILGLANHPAFDPNNISKVSMDFVRNRAISDSFEPGSVFKIVTASAALEEKAVDFNSAFYCERGTYKVGKRVLHDYRPYGVLKFREIIEKSSNIGTVKVAEKIGKDKLSKYIELFNFNRFTGVDLPGEVSGIMRNPRTWSYVDMTTIPMGQGIAVTSLQLASAVSVIANGGVFVQPHVVKKILDEEGVVIKENKPKAARRVISKETADKVKELLGGVVDHGTGTRAKLDNFRACGKTGTAQKVRGEGGYYDDKYIASFIGFAPYDNPVLALAICVDSPRGQYFGGQVAAPAFKNIMEQVLTYMAVRPDRKI